MLRIRLSVKPRVGVHKMLNLYLFLAAVGTVFHTPVTGNELFRNISPKEGYYPDAYPLMNTNVNEWGENLPE